MFTIGMKINILNTNIPAEDNTVGDIEMDIFDVSGGGGGVGGGKVRINEIRIEDICRQGRRSRQASFSSNISPFNPFYIPIKLIQSTKRKDAKIHPECNPKCGGPICSGCANGIGNRIRTTGCTELDGYV